MTREFLQTVLFNNSIQSWGVAVIVIIIALLLCRYISRAIVLLSVKYFTKVARSNFQIAIKENIVSPLSHFLFWTTSITAISKLNYPDVLKFSVFRLEFKEVLSSISIGWLTICFFQLIIGILLFVSIVLKTVAERKNERSLLQMISLLTDLIKVTLMVICVLVILKLSLKYSLGNFVTSLGLVTAALALAAKETVENIICSFIILIDKPFLVGDSIKVNSVGGTVEKIGLRSTLLRTDAKTIVNIPNRQVAGNTLENVSNQTFRKFSQILELDLSTKPEDIRKLIDAILELLKSNASNGVTNITVYFQQTGINSHKVYMEYFAQNNIALSRFQELNQEINLALIGIINTLKIILVTRNTSSS